MRLCVENGLCVGFEPAKRPIDAGEKRFAFAVVLEEAPQTIEQASDLAELVVIAAAIRERHLEPLAELLEHVLEPAPPAACSVTDVTLLEELERRIDIRGRALLAQDNGTGKSSLADAIGTSRARSSCSPKRGALRSGFVAHQSEELLACLGLELGHLGEDLFEETSRITALHAETEDRMPL